jgi:hypothetical protein
MATPWVKVSQIAMRPARSKALIINAFALAGRFAVFQSVQRVCQNSLILKKSQSPDFHKPGLCYV